MASIVAYSVISLLCGFAPSLAVLLFLRALFGIAMGGEWGLGASLAMESVPPETRGLLSGILQSGYSVGYLLAAMVYRLVFPTLRVAGDVFCRADSGGCCRFSFAPKSTSRLCTNSRKRSRLGSLTGRYKRGF